MTEVPAPDRPLPDRPPPSSPVPASPVPASPRPAVPVAAGQVLAHAVGEALIGAPAGKIDIFEWLRTLPDGEYRRCAPPDHKAAGYTVTDEGRPMTVMVEMIGTGLFVHHYEYAAAGRQHCRLVSVSDLLTPAGWTTCGVSWELRAEPVDAQTSRYVNTVTSHPTAEFLRFTAGEGQGFAAAAAAAQTALADHCRRETARYAESIDRHANALG